MRKLEIQYIALFFCLFLLMHQLSFLGLDAIYVILYAFPVRKRVKRLWFLFLWKVWIMPDLIIVAFQLSIVLPSFLIPIFWFIHITGMELSALASIYANEKFARKIFKTSFNEIY